MANFVAGGVTFQPGENAPSLASGKFWLHRKVGERQETAVEYEFPGVDGVGVKWLGFRGRRIEVEVMYKGATQADVLSAWDADMTALSGTTFSVTVPDYPAAFENCRLIPNGFPAGEVYPLPGGGFIMQTTIAMRQMWE